jgi:hypothetical protein
LVILLVVFDDLSRLQGLSSQPYMKSSLSVD